MPQIESLIRSRLLARLLGIKNCPDSFGVAGQSNTLEGQSNFFTVFQEFYQ